MVKESGREALKQWYIEAMNKKLYTDAELMEDVKNYDELLSAMQKHKNFERLILSMTVDKIAGKSSLAKNKSIR